MEYFNKIRSTVNQVAAQVSNALPGNPLTREYEVMEQIATAGPGLFWKIYAGKKRSSQQPVAVWLFEKRDMDKWSKEDKEEFVVLLKRGVSQLTRLRHPRLLIIEHPIEESRDSLAFATEPIFASLANCLGSKVGFEPGHLVDFALLDIEIKHGLLQLAEALAFLHIDARMIHRHLCPASVLVNDRGAWKLAGFDFAIQGTVPAGNANQIIFDCSDYDEGKMQIMQPRLEYLAPELGCGGHSGTYADIFSQAKKKSGDLGVQSIRLLSNELLLKNVSLGITTFAVFNKGEPPVQYKGSLMSLKKTAEKLKQVPEAFMSNIPFAFRDDYKMCLNCTPDLRPDATQFTKIAFFDDPRVKTLNHFESLMQMDNNQKMNFFKSLPPIISKFEKRVLLQKVLPFLCAEFSTPDLIPFILPSVFIITEQATQQEFTQRILPALVPVFTMSKPYQIMLLLLQRMELLLAKAAEEDLKRHILPLIYNAIGSETTRIQELCLAIVPTIGHIVDRQSMKAQLLPKLIKLATEAGILAVRVQALICLGKLLPTLESWMVTQQVLPALPRITSKEPGVLMAILGIYKLSFESDKFGVTREQLAKSALPFLMATSVENTLNLGQFEQFISLIRSMTERVENEQRKRLQQLSAGQEEQRSGPNFENSMSENPKHQVSSDLADLMSASRQQVSTKPASSGGGLSLEDKKKLAAAQSSGGPSTAAAKSGQPARQEDNPRVFNPLPSNFDPFSSLTASSVLSPAPSYNNKTVDLSDLMLSNNVPSRAAPMTTSPPFPQMSSVNPHFLPQPPRSANAPIQRQLQKSNPLDSLLSFPGKSSEPMSSLLGTKPSASSMAQPKKDPFADLLG